MVSHRESFWKTIAMTAAGALALTCLSVLAVVHVAAPFGHIAAAAMLVPSALAYGVVAGGLLVLYRDHCQWTGKPDLFHVLTRSRVTRRTHSFWRRLLGGSLRPGDVVQVRAPAEIARTLDDDGMMDGLPFMPEMLAYCGKTFRVDRRVDKINDMITKTGLRRMTGTVTLDTLRCDGSAHGGCDAECQILWKEAWLRRLPSGVQCETGRGSDPGDNALPSMPAKANTAQPAANDRAGAAGGDARYRCQITELLNASRPMKRWDVRQDLRPLFWGNVGFVAFSTVLLTALFNSVQRWRGGVDYPWRPQSVGDGTPLTDLALKPGEWVRVKDGRQIAQTLSAAGRNRGMWFDREMLRFCGQRFKVRRRVERLVDERSGKMLRMKTPCITLEGATATGEFLRFCPQNEYVFWRETWLERTEYDQPGPASGRHECATSERAAQKTIVG